MEELINALPGSTFANVLCVCAADVARCLNGAVAVGCGFFSCLENSTCDTDGMHEICELFLHTAATFNTEVSAAFGPSAQTARLFPPLQHPTVLFLCRERPLWKEACSASRRESPRRFSKPSAAATSSRGWSRRSVSENNPQQVAPLTFSYSRLSAPLKVQEECYTSLDICTVARTNPDTIGDVVQVPTHFPNRSGTCWASWYHCIDAALTVAS